MGGVVNAVSGAIKDVGDVVVGAGNAVGDVATKAVKTVADHPLEAAALAAGGYYFAPEIGAWIGADGTALAGTEAGVAAGTAPTAIADLGTATGADLSAAYDMGAVGAAGAGGPVAAGTGAALGAGAAAAASGLGQYATPLAIAGSSLLGANAAKSAADTQAAATDRANQLIYQMYQEQKGLQEPYRAAGVTAQNRLMDLLGLSGNTGAADYGSANKNFAPSDLTTDPSYQFRLGEGLKALDRQAAVRGGLISGGAIKAAQEYGQQSASQEYQNAFNRYQTNRTNMLQPLGNLISSGQNAAANLGSAAGNYGANASNNITSGAAANAAGTVGSANALASGVGQYLNYSGNQDLLNTIRQSAYKVNP